MEEAVSIERGNYPALRTIAHYLNPVTLVIQSRAELRQRRAARRNLLFESVFSTIGEFAILPFPINHA